MIGLKSVSYGGLRGFFPFLLTAYLWCLLIASTKFSVFGVLHLILAILNFLFSILQVGCLSEIINF